MLRNVLYYKKVYALRPDQTPDRFILTHKEAIPLKYWRGYLVAAIVAAITWALSEFARSHTMLVDMLWPYVTRTYQTYMSAWSSGVSFCVWQVIFVLLIVLLLASIVLMIILKWNPIQWFGWVLAAASLLFFVHTGVYGLNANAGSIADDIHLTESEYTLAELEEAAVYYRDKANELAGKVDRDGDGNVKFADFAQLAEAAGEGYDILVKDRSCSVFAGARDPVKELGWADNFTSMGITGVTIGMTGEAAVNPQIPDVTIPFTMCHEMAHRMSIATERDANFAGFLACSYHPDVEFQYSAYFMAYRYCYSSLMNVGATAAAGRVSSGVDKLLQRDMAYYDDFFHSNRDESATKAANKANDTLLKASGDDSGIKSYGEVTDLLVSWHIQEVVLPAQAENEEQKFNPYDPSQVDLTGLVNAK